MRDVGATEPDEGENEAGMQQIRDASGCATTNAGETTRGDAHAHRRGEHGSDHVGDTIGPEFGIGIGAFTGPMTPTEMFDDARRDKQINSGDESETGGGWNYAEYVSGGPREAGEGWNFEREATHFALVQVERDRDGDRTEYADERRWRFRKEAGA